MKTADRVAARGMRGVTLIEVLIVVAIMALVSSAVAVAATKYYAVAKEKTAKNNAMAVRDAVKAWWFMTEASACPSVAELFTSGVLDEASPKSDPWGSPWHIECAGAGVTVSSDGADRSAGTPDDIRVPPKTT